MPTEATRENGQPISAVVDLPQTEALYKSEPPPFGRALLKCFAFDPEYVNLNHGSYGSLSLPVREASEALSKLIERNPDKFNRFTYQPLLVHIRERLAKFIGAETDEVVLVANASQGITTVLRNFEWHEGDILIEATTTYNSVSKTIQYLSDVSPHPTASLFNLQFPTTHAEILSAFRDHLRALPKRHSNTNNPQKIVAVIDSIASNPGVLLPWQEMVKICREEGVWSVIDAAHSLGQENGLDVGASGCDFWISNCHKWLIGKRTSAVLYVPKRNQYVIKSPIPTPSTYLPQSDKAFPGMVVLFEWNGTIDFIPRLTLGAALDFRSWLGGEEKINSYCHSLALAGGKRLAEILGTEVLHGKDEDELTLNMVNVSLPIPSEIKYTWAIDGIFRERLINDWNTYVAHFPHNGKVWVRCSAQIWNEIGDFEYAGKALKAICEEIVEAHKDKV